MPIVLGELDTVEDFASYLRFKEQEIAGRRVVSDLPPTSRTSLKLVKSVNQPENDGHEEEQIQRRTDHRVPAAG